MNSQEFLERARSVRRDKVTGDVDVASLAQRIMSMVNADRRPTLTLFCGPPGSGKTTLATRLAAEGHGIRIATDEWQTRLGVPHGDAHFHDVLQRELYQHALTLLRAGVDVILEDGLWLPDERREKFADAREVGARISWHVFELSEATLWTRLQRRNAAAAASTYPMSRAELQAVLSVFVAPTDEELASVDSVHLHTEDAP